MRKRKGWYKKARIKFVWKRVFSYTYEKDVLSSYMIEVYRDTVEFSYSTKDDWYQRLKKIENKGFIGGFWYARALSKKHIGNFYWDRILKEEVMK